MRMFLYPAYVCLQSAKANSRSLFQALKDLGVEVEAAFWHGTLDSLPDDRPSIIRASSMMSCAGNELAQRCAQLGHFAFYNDSYLSADGTYKSDDLIETLTAFIEKNRQAAELTKQEVVDFLVSQPEGSSVDCGLYIERQAALLLKLWDEHVIAGKNSPTGSEFEDEYPQVTSRPDRQLRESASIPEHMGFAIQDIQSLVLALGQDTAKIKI
ncbi:MAG: hypothetical protein HYZ62_01135, partial [Candidatus Andersenbacteria bacterium]|nr:hypothetical protein [Candidatus Andersenbacteria bacterium]